MKKKSKKEKAKELWDYLQIRKVYENDDNNEDMLKLILVCGNCNRHDMLVNFREEEKIHKTPLRDNPVKPWDPNHTNPYDPYKYWKKWRITYGTKTSNTKTPKFIHHMKGTTNSNPNNLKLMTTSQHSSLYGLYGDGGYKKFFKCPNCGSAFIYPLNPEVIVAETI